MGFTVNIESNYGGEILSNYPTGGKAVFALLSGLQTYCMMNEDIEDWYAQLEEKSGELFCEKCRELLDCMWGDGGDSSIYYEDEYEFYKKRGGILTEEEFQDMVIYSRKAFQPTQKVRDAALFLLQLFKDKQPEPLEGFYQDEDTIPDFEALVANLDLLIQRGSQNVRLNFS